MKIQVKRTKQGKESTLSEIYVDGEFICYGLEDAVREKKESGVTAIPAGAYRLGLNRYGGMNSRYKRDYPNMHRGMIEIMHIPEFSYVYIHIGNDIGNTSGCLLVGDRYIVDNDKDYVLRKSAPAYKRLYALLIQAVSQDEAEIIISNEYTEKKKKTA